MASLFSSQQDRAIFPVDFFKITVVAPAGPFPKEDWLRAQRAIPSKNLALQWDDKSLFAGDDLPYLSANDTLRAHDLNHAFSSDTDLIWCLRGGYGTMRILDQISWQNANKRVMGFSDITALLMAMYARGVGTPIAGIHAGRFELEKEFEPTRRSMQWALNPQGSFEIPFRSQKIYREGVAEGPILPVNLSIFHSLIGTPYMPNLRGVVLLIEDVGEPLRKLDRFLAHLKLAGILGEISGLVLGYFTESDFDVERDQLFQYYAASVHGPVAGEVMFGHDAPQSCIPMGIHSRFSAQNHEIHLILNP